jgi:hypothetical protein
MQRRKFVFLSVIGGTAVGLTGLSCSHQKAGLYTILDRPIQLSQICDTKTLREIGMEYRLQIPTESEADQLVSLLSADSAGYPISKSADHVFVKNMIDRQILEDFEKGNTVVIKGWILSVTEARQCALFFLNNK